MPKARYNSGFLTTSYKDIVFAEVPCELKWMWITNRGSSAAKVEIAHVPDGQAAGETMDLIHDFSLDANNYVTNEILVYLQAGDKITAKSDSADSIVITFYGTEEYRIEQTSMPTVKRQPKPVDRTPFKSPRQSTAYRGK